MDKKNFWTVVVSVVLAVLFVAIFPVAKTGISQLAGGLTHQSDITINPAETGDGFSVGAASSAASKYTLIETGTCSLLANFSITASTTRGVDCVIADALSGDIIYMQLAASTTLASQYTIKSAQASTTAGFGSAQLINWTGGNATPAATNGFGSSTVYTLFRKI